MRSAAADRAATAPNASAELRGRRPDGAPHPRLGRRQRAGPSGTVRRGGRDPDREPIARNRRAGDSVNGSSPRATGSACHVQPSTLRDSSAERRRSAIKDKSRRHPLPSTARDVQSALRATNERPDAGGADRHFAPANGSCFQHRATQYYERASRARSWRRRPGAGAGQGSASRFSTTHRRVPGAAPRGSRGRARAGNGSLSPRSTRSIYNESRSRVIPPRPLTPADASDRSDWRSAESRRLAGHGHRTRWNRVLRQTAHAAQSPPRTDDCEPRQGLALPSCHQERTAGDATGSWSK